MKTVRASMGKTIVAPIIGVVVLTLLVAGGAWFNLHRSNAGTDAAAPKPAHHMASLSEVKAALRKAQGGDDSQ